MKTKNEHLSYMFERTTFPSLNEAVNSIDILEKESKKVISLGDTGGTLHDGALIVYGLSNSKYSGVVLDMYLDTEEQLIYIVVKRLGITDLHDVILCGQDYKNVIGIVDAFSGQYFQQIEQDNYLTFVELFNILTYNSADGNERMMTEMANVLESWNDMEGGDFKTSKTIH